MNHQLEDCQRKLDALFHERQSLSVQMCALADALQGDIDELHETDLQQALQRFRERAMQLQQDMLGTRELEPNTPIRLQRLKEHLATLKADDERRQRVLRAHAIQPVTDAQSHLQEQLNSFVTQSLQGDQQGIQNAGNAVEALLALISGDDLSDETWDAHFDFIANAISRDIAVAAVRGRLTLASPGESQPSEPANDTLTH
ncbi:MAG: hypothetical protein KDA88_11860 [Planctomycetaceae bacterium]|nr:hypothetical protein [Planctomycetaceae bacterium]MCB9949442.1 hypothetical protein [Planctomycetaceae bacterium]